MHELLSDLDNLFLRPQYPSDGREFVDLSFVACPISTHWVEESDMCVGGGGSWGEDGPHFSMQRRITFYPSFG